MTNRDQKIILKHLNQFKKEHKRSWYDFARGFLPGYSNSLPKYDEAKVTDFEEWVKSLGSDI